MQTTSLDIMSRFKGLYFTVIGPFLVADLTKKKDFFSKIAVAQHGMESLKKGEKTVSHTHDFPSFYKSEGLDVECQGERTSLPRLSLVLVLPGIGHSWIPQKSTGSVGSVDHRHKKQIFSEAYSG